jgi:hypothetical protein
MINDCKGERLFAMLFDVSYRRVIPENFEEIYPESRLHNSLIYKRMMDSASCFVTLSNRVE